MDRTGGATQEPEAPNEPWSQRIKDRWFLSVLGLSALAVAALFSPFLYVLLTASVVVVVAWPLFDRALVACRGHRVPAAALTVLVLALVLGVPLGVVVYLFVAQAVSVVSMGAEYVQSGALAEQLTYLGSTTAWMPDWIARWLPADFDLEETVVGPLQERAMWALGLVGGALPALIGSAFNAGIDLVLFLLAVATLFVEGPRVLRALSNLSPLDDAYEARLFATFADFAKSVVVGTAATAMVQAVVAGVGYAIAGVDRLVFFSILTGIFSLVPVFGTAVIWAPLAVVVGLEHGVGWGAFVAGWGLAVAQLDNFVRPLFMRGRTNVHPLLIFLAVFGGMAWMGVAGVLAGPVVVVLFLAMYTIYVEDYLGLHVPEGTAPKPPEQESAVRRALRRFRGRRSAPTAPPAEEEVEGRLPPLHPGPTAA